MRFGVPFHLYTVLRVRRTSASSLHTLHSPKAIRDKTAIWRAICIMALTSWKSFPFFTVTQVPVPADPDGSYVFDVCRVCA